MFIQNSINMYTTLWCYGRHTKKKMFFSSKIEKDNSVRRLVYFAFYDVAKINRKTCIEMKDLGHIPFQCMCVQRLRHSFTLLFRYFLFLQNR